MGEGFYEMFLTISIGIVFITQMNFTLMSDATISSETLTLKTNNNAIFPVGLFGIAHALFVTI